MDMSESLVSKCLGARDIFVPGTRCPVTPNITRLLSEIVNLAVVDSTANKQQS